MDICKLWAALAVVAAFAGCGQTVGEQALYGAGAGALGSLVMEGDVVTGAALGAAGNLLYCQKNLGVCN
ncbi:MAG: hypothetical protein AB8B51_10265 [Sedimentitalea sp.]